MLCHIYHAAKVFVGIPLKRELGLYFKLFYYNQLPKVLHRRRMTAKNVLSTMGSDIDFVLQFKYISEINLLIINKCLLVWQDLKIIHYKYC